jgi:hypothetical protein
MSSETHADTSGRVANVLLACWGCAASAGAVLSFVNERLELGGLLALASAVCFSGIAISNALRNRR